MLVIRYLIKDVIDHSYLGNNYDINGRLKFMPLNWPTNLKLFQQ